MTQGEFIDYLKFIEKTIDAKVPTDKESLDAWYKTFENTNVIIAKKMATMYLQKETGYFKLSKLLEYKSAAMAGATYRDTPVTSCPACKGTGYIIVRPKHREDEYPYEKCRRCCCSAGSKLPNYIVQVTPEELRVMHREWNEVWLL